MKTFTKEKLIKYIDDKSSLIERLIIDGWEELKEEVVEEVKEVKEIVKNIKKGK